MSQETPVALLWEEMLLAAAAAPPTTHHHRARGPHSRRRRGHGDAARYSVYKSKQQPGRFWCAVPCRPERVTVKKREKKVTFSPIVTVIEFTAGLDR